MPDDPPREDAPVGDAARASREELLALNFAVEAGQLMLESSTSVSEVIDRLRRFLPAVGLDGCSVDAFPSMLIVSYRPPARFEPVTIMKDARASEPHLERLATTLSLLERVERREVGLEEARSQLQAVVEAPRRQGLHTRVALLVSVFGWVLFLNGAGVSTVLVVLLATALTFPISATVRRVQLPAIVGTFAAAVVLSAVPSLMAMAGLSLPVAVAVAAGLFIYLPGRALTTAVIDGLANVPVSGMGRALDAILTAGALAVGVVVGGQIGAAPGVVPQADSTGTPLWLSVAGAGVGVLGLAVAWGSPRRQVAPTVLLGCMASLVVGLVTDGGASGWLAALLAAALVGFSGALVAHLHGGSASLYTGVAILPLVPGFDFFQGMLALTQGQQDQASGSLREAATIALAVAGGTTVGLALGRNLQALGRWFGARRQRGRNRRPPSAPAAEKVADNTVEAPSPRKRKRP